MSGLNYNGEVIWIIGASSGIGKALAKTLDSYGATLILSARRLDALEKVTKSFNAKHKCISMDVSKAEEIKKTIDTVYSMFTKIDRVVFLAAVYAPMKLSDLDLDTTRKIIEVNILGAFLTINALLPKLKEQTKAQLSLCGSVAGYFGLPMAQPYGATKAAIINLAESLRNECPKNIDIKLISPGFVKTPMTDKNKFPMPMIITPQKAANYIATGLLKNKFEINFPRRFTLWLKLLSLLPYRISLNITSIMSKTK